jgi:hypothetical protein
MNENPPLQTVSPSSSDAPFDRCVREHPATACLAALGLGLLLGAAVRGLAPKPKEGRLAQLLEDFEERLHDIGVPAAARRLGELAESGASAVKDRAAVCEASVSRALRHLSRRMRDLLS